MQPCNCTLPSWLNIRLPMKSRKNHASPAPVHVAIGADTGFAAATAHLILADMTPSNVRRLNGRVTHTMNQPSGSPPRNTLDSKQTADRNIPIFADREGRGVSLPTFFHRCKCRCCGRISLAEAQAFLPFVAKCRQASALMAATLHAQGCTAVPQAQRSEGRRPTMGAPLSTGVFAHKKGYSFPTENTCAPHW